MYVCIFVITSIMLAVVMMGLWNGGCMKIDSREPSIRKQKEEGKGNKNGSIQESERETDRGRERDLLAIVNSIYRGI